MDSERLGFIRDLSEHCMATSTGSGSFPLSIGRKLAQNSLDLLDEVERLQKLLGKVPLEIGDVVCEPGDDEPVGVVTHIDKSADEDYYEVKLNSPYPSFDHISYYRSELELVERPEK